MLEPGLLSPRPCCFRRARPTPHPTPQPPPGGACVLAAWATGVRSCRPGTIMEKGRPFSRALRCPSLHTGSSVALAFVKGLVCTTTPGATPAALLDLRAGPDQPALSRCGNTPGKAPGRPYSAGKWWPGGPQIPVSPRPVAFRREVPVCAMGRCPKVSGVTPDGFLAYQGPRVRARFFWLQLLGSADVLVAPSVNPH